MSRREAWGSVLHREGSAAYSTSEWPLSWPPNLTPGLVSLFLSLPWASSHHTEVTVGSAHTASRTSITEDRMYPLRAPGPRPSPHSLVPPAGEDPRSAACSTHTLSGSPVSEKTSMSGPLPGDCPPAMAPGGRHVCGTKPRAHTGSQHNTWCRHPPPQGAVQPGPCGHTHTHAHMQQAGSPPALLRCHHSGSSQMPPLDRCPGGPPA